jgi:hypothetical protein
MKDPLEKKIVRYGIFALVSFAGLTGLSAAASSPGYNFLIEQSAPAGPHRIQITEQGMLIESFKFGSCFQYRVADNTMTVWSVKRHVYYTVPYEKWLSSYRNMYAAVSWYSELTKPIKETKQVKDQLTYHVYHYRVDAGNPSFWRSDIGHKDGSAEMTDVDVTTVDLPVFKQAGQILERIYGSPRLGGFPYTIRRSVMSTPSLETIKVSTAHNKPLSFLAPASLYKKVPFSNQLFGPSFDENMTKMLLPY